MSLIVSNISFGLNINSTIDNGVIDNGGENQVHYYLRNTYAEPITNLKVFFIPVPDVEYTGDFTAADDFNKFKEWGDNNLDENIGLTINLNPNGADWHHLKTGVMDDVTTGLILPTTTGIANAGVLAPNESEEAHIVQKIRVPDNEETVGYREFEIAFSYNRVL